MTIKRCIKCRRNKCLIYAHGKCQSCWYWDYLKSHPKLYEKMLKRGKEWRDKNKKYVRDYYIKHKRVIKKRALLFYYKHKQK